MVNPNTPLDAFLEAISFTYIPTFALVPKKVAWGISIDVSATRRRYVLVNADTFVQEVLDFILSLENIDIDARQQYGIYRQCRENDSSHISRYLDSDEQPFEINSQSRLHFSKLKPEDLVTRLHNIPKSEKTSNLNSSGDVKDAASEEMDHKMQVAKSEKLMSWFGINNDQLIVEGDDKGLSIGSGLDFEGRHLERKKTASKLSIADRSSLADNDSLSAKVYGPVPMPTERSVSGTSIDVLEEEETIELNHKKKASKLLDLFGVKPGEKERTVITNMSRDHRKYKKKPTLASNNYVTRIYFDNAKGYVSFCLPMDITAKNALKLMIKRLNIHDELSHFALFECKHHSEEEREIPDAELLFNTMFGWEHDEIFVFKRRVQKALRAATSYSPDHTDVPTIQVEGETEESTSHPVSHLSATTPPAANVQQPKTKRSSKRSTLFEALGFRKKVAHEISKIVDEIQEIDMNSPIEEQSAKPVIEGNSFSVVSQKSSVVVRGVSFIIG